MKKKGEDTKTIITTIYIFTNNIPKETPGKSYIGEEGYLSMKTNKTNGVEKEEHIHFKKLDDIPDKLRKVIEKANLVIYKK